MRLRGRQRRRKRHVVPPLLGIRSGDRGWGMSAAILELALWAGAAAALLVIAAPLAWLLERIDQR